MQDDAEQFIHSEAQVLVAEAIPGSPAFGNGLDQSASAQACQLIGHDLSRDPERIGQVRGKARGIAQRKQDADPFRFGQRVPESRQSRCMRRSGCSDHQPMVQKSLDSWVRGLSTRSGEGGVPMFLLKRLRVDHELHVEVSLDCEGSSSSRK